jgi:hypothetical protein
MYVGQFVVVPVRQRRQTKQSPEATHFTDLLLTFFGLCCDYCLAMQKCERKNSFAFMRPMTNLSQCLEVCATMSKFSESGVF